MAEAVTVSSVVSCSFTSSWFVFAAEFKGHLVWAGPLTTSICRESLLLAWVPWSYGLEDVQGLHMARFQPLRELQLCLRLLFVLWRLWCKAQPGHCVIKAWSNSWGRMDWEKVLQSLFVKGEIWKNWKNPKKEVLFLSSYVEPFLAIIC